MYGMKVIAHSVFVFCWLFIYVAAYSQNNGEITQRDGLLTYKYTMSGEGKHGPYQLFYKDQCIEKGFYNKGKKVGKWQYLSFNNMLEYEYDFDACLITRIGGEGINDNKRFNTPCFFRGSPLIPYLFMVNNVYYPDGAVDKNIAGRVVLTLKIDKKGKVYAYYISQKLHYVLDKAVKDAAAKIPAEWCFLPATREGQPLISEYNIAVEFEL